MQRLASPALTLVLCLSVVGVFASPAHAQTGKITGKVTDAVTSQPIQSSLSNFAQISLFGATGNLVTSTATDSAGDYQFANLSPGTYFVRTAGNWDYVDQLFNAADCNGGACTVTSGTPLVVTAGGTATANFSMSKGGKIAGFLRREGTTQSVQNAKVRFFTSAGLELKEVFTDFINGNYSIRGLAAGSYFARTTNTLGLIDEIYDNIPCSGCTTAQVLAGTAIVVVADPALTTTVNFELAAGGSITGRVSNATNVSLANVTITLVNASNVTVATATTNSSGNYTLAAVPQGTYYARTSNSAGFGNKVYNNKACDGCNAATTGDPITVTTTTVSGINFVLSNGGSVSGTVRRQTGASLPGVVVQAYSASGTLLASATSASNGTYTITGVPAGSVFLRTTNSLGLIDFLYGGIPCFGCNPTAGSPVTVVTDATTSGIDFQLTPGGRVGGRVTNAGTGAGLAGVSVSVFGAGGDLRGTTQTDGTGAWISVPQIPTSVVNVIVYEPQGFVTQLYNQIACPGCTSVNGGTRIRIDVDTTVTGIDFPLVASGSISGTLHATGVSATGAVVEAYNAANKLVGQGMANSLGQYVITGLPSGSYFVRTNVGATLPYPDQVYATPANLPCQACNPTTIGTAVSVSAPTATLSIDFVLQPGGTVAGRVTAASGGAALLGIAVQALDTTGQVVKATTTTVTGDYTIDGLPDGTYYLRTDTTTHVNQIFNGVTCLGCTVSTGTALTVISGQTLNGRDFALQAGGHIAGTVRDGTVGLPGVTIIFSRQGFAAGSAVTNSAGEYRSPALPSGTYSARTSNSFGYLDEVFDNLTCFQCGVASGTPIVVSAGSDSTASFGLVVGGAISGTVKGPDSLPLAGVTVTLYGASAQPLSTATTSATGTYQTPLGLPAGTYYVRFTAPGYVSEVYNDLVCLNCPHTNGQPIAVTAGGVTPGINATLAAGNTVTGTVTASGGAGLEGVTVSLYRRVNEALVATAATASNGTFSFSGIPAGDYYARTSQPLGYIDEPYGGTGCAGCHATYGSAIPVVDGVPTVLNFSLQFGGQITGTIKNGSGTALRFVMLELFDAQNRLVAAFETTSVGTYRTPGLPTGQYFLKSVRNESGLLNVLYQSAPCLNCPANTGTPIAVTTGVVTSGIDMTLPAGATVSGIVRDTLNQPLAGVSVDITLVDGSTAALTTTNAAGQFQATGLPAGTYSARTHNRLGYIDRIFNDIECLSCGAASGTAIPLAAGATNAGINFTLAAGGGISGRIIRNTQGLAGVDVLVYTSSGNFVETVTSNANGAWVTTKGLPAGLYLARTQNNLNLIDLVYNGPACQGCDIVAFGLPIQVTGTAVTTGIDFTLTPAGFIEGRVRNLSGAGLEAVPVEIYDAQGRYVTTAFPNASGDFRSQGLATGSYYLRTRNSDGYTDALYDGVDCAPCVPPGAGTPVAVTGGQTTANRILTLRSGSRISGTVRTAGAVPIPNVTVVIFNGVGLEVTRGVTGGDGAYVTNSGVEAGVYYARTINSSGFIDRIYNLASCPGCAVTVGTPITVVAHTERSGVDFTLALGGRIAGTVTETAGGAPIFGATVQVYSTAGVLLGESTTGTTGQYTSPALGAGSYLVKAESASGHIARVYNNLPCPACTVLIGSPVVVASNATTTGIDFALVSGGRLDGNVIDISTLAPLSGVSVEIFDAGGTLVTTALTDGAGRWAAEEGLPTGSYFVRTVNTLGYIDMLTGTPCFGCPPTSGHPVAVTAGARAGVSFALTRGGRIAGAVTDQLGGAIAGVTVQVFNAAGHIVGSGMTDGAGGYLVATGLPAGSYWLRTRNAAPYINQAYNGPMCLECDPRNRTAVTVAGTATTTGINFALIGGSMIEGHVTAGDTGNGLGNVTVAIYNAVGTMVTSGQTNNDGYYQVSGLVPASYRLRTFNLRGYVDEAFDNLACVPCNVLTSTPIVVGAATVEKNLGLDRGGVISGHVFDSVSNAPVVGVTVSFIRASDSVMVGTTQPTDAAGYYAISLPVGAYTAQVNGANGYAQPSPDPRGRWSAKSVITVTSGQEVAGVTFGLTPCTPPAFSIDSLLGGRMGLLYSQPITASGGTGARTFSLTAGVLVPGLTLSTQGLLAGTPTSSGDANFTVGVTDGAGCVATRVFSLSVEAAPSGPNTAPIGYVDTPRQNAAGVTGMISMTGWAIDDQGLSHVRIYRACLPVDATCQIVLNRSLVFIGEAAFVPGARPDVQAAYPAAANASSAGWGLPILTNMLPHVPGGRANGGQGTLDLYAIATDIEGLQTLLGNANEPGIPLTPMPTRINMSNDTAVAPFGTMDTPAIGATVSGTVPSFGWALTPDANTASGDAGDILMPLSGSTLTVFIDGVPSGTVSYNQCRGSVGVTVPALTYCNDDVANVFGNLFPQAPLSSRFANPTRYRNLDAGRAAIGVFSFDSRTLSNGRHSIAWSATDSAGRAAGLGSRIFTVANTAGDEWADVARPQASAAVAAIEAAAPDAGVWARTGYSTSTTWIRVQADETGRYAMRIPEMGRLELSFGELITEGVIVANGAAAPLPIGATLSGERFVWVPPPGYIGSYLLSFAHAGGRFEVVITVNR